MGLSAVSTMDAERDFETGVKYSGKRLRDYILQKGNDYATEMIGRIFLGRDESLNARAIYTPEYGIINSSTFFDVLTLTTLNLRHHRLTLRSHLNDPEISALDLETLEHAALSLGINPKHLAEARFLPDGRVDLGRV